MFCLRYVCRLLLVDLVDLALENKESENFSKGIVFDQLTKVLTILPETCMYAF